LRSKEQSDANIENLHSQITKANKIIEELNLPREEISILELRWQIEESKKIKEALSIQVTEKDAFYCKLEEEVISLKMKLEEANKNVNKYFKFEKSTDILDDMLKQQRDHKIKFGLGYDAKQPSSSKATEKKTSNVVGIRNKEHKVESSKVMAKDKEAEHRRPNEKKRRY